MNNINANTIGQFFQDIISQFSDMSPTNMDALENKVLDAIYKLGSLLMEWKLSNWNDDLKKDNCQQCNTKLQNRNHSRQLATMVSDVSFTRYMSYCPNCRIYTGWDTRSTSTPKDEFTTRGVISTMWCFILCGGVMSSQNPFSRRFSQEGSPSLLCQSQYHPWTNECSCRVSIQRNRW